MWTLRMTEFSETQHSSCTYWCQNTHLDTQISKYMSKLSRFLVFVDVRYDTGLKECP